ncbi:spermidine synthase [Flavobacterium sp. GCM10027622]|uniref:spermidine synthase n=1 Tax=unclassified Flavobacterium TaxID=196869 RepID=UPI00360C27DD
MNFKRILSYFYPITIHQTLSDINQNLEITWNNGQLVLDSKNTNFSYGSLQRVMRIGLNRIGKDRITQAESILLLGVAGGSVIQTLRKEYHTNGKITGVEIDEKTIALANTYFSLNTISNLEIVINDASEYIKTTSGKFDLLIIDIFQDKIMPDFLFTDEFITNIKRILTNNGFVLFNSIVTLSDDYERNKKFEKLLQSKFKTVIKVSRVEGDNELFIFSNENH